MASKGLNKVINGVAAARIWQKTNQLADLDSDSRAAAEKLRSDALRRLETQEIYF